MSEPRSILIFRNGSLGNTIVAIPAMRAIRKQWPEAQLHLIVDSLGHELFRYCPWFQTVIAYDKRGADRGLRAHLRFVSGLRGLAPTHAVLFKRFYRNGLLAYLSGANVRAGFRTDGSGPFLNLTIPYDETVSVIDLNLRLAAEVGASSDERTLELFLSSADHDDAGEQLQRRKISGPFMIAHYGGTTTAPDFISPARYSALLRRLNREEYPTLLIGAGQRERESAATIASELNWALPATDLPIRTLAALLQRARAYIGINSGPAHVAAAMGTPGLVLFQPDDRLDRELVKWRPGSDLMASIVPPVTDFDSDWLQFNEQSESVLSKLIERKTRAKGIEL